MEGPGTGNVFLYLFSGVYAMVNRAMNIEYDRDLVFLHHVLKSVHEAFNNRNLAIPKGGDQTVPIFVWQTEKLRTLLSKLGKEIAGGENCIDTLKDFIELAYITTGNGFYLFGKGKIGMESPQA